MSTPATPSRSPHVIDVAERDFQALVLDRSKQLPVIVDFWAPWCGPCRQIGPVLEKLAEEANGAILLAKVNTDEAPYLSQALQITGIPLVMAFRDGQPVDEFTGALPEAQIREFVGRYLPAKEETPVDKAEKLRAAGRSEEAEAILTATLEKDRDDPAALLTLAKLRLDQKREADALALIDEIPPGPERREGDRLAAETRVRASSIGEADRAAFEQRLAAAPDDLEARYQLARALAAAGEYEAALAHDLEIVRRNRAFREDGARKAMLDLFEILGRDHPLTERFRAELATILFS